MKSRLNKTILLVEDDIVLAMTEKTMLENYGYIVFTASSSEKAIEAVATHSNIDLILMDIDLGEGLDGPETAETILKDNDIPIVFLWSHTEPEIVEKTERITSYGYVVKNSSITVIDASIKMAFKLFDAKKKILLSEDNFRSLYDNAPGMIHSIDSSGVLVSVNDLWVTTLGYKREEVLGQKSTAFLTDDSRKYATEIVLPKFYAEGFVNQIEFQFVKKNGEIIDTILTAFSERDLNGGFLRSIAMITDITESKQAEEALQENQSLLLAIVEGTSDAVFVKDIQGRYRIFNSAACLYAGKPATEILGYDDTVLFPPEQARPLMEGDRQVMMSGCIQTYEEPALTTSIGEVTFLTTKGPLRNKRGEIIGLFGISRDITKRKQAEIALQQSKSDLQEAQRIAHVGSWRLDLVTNHVFWTEQLYLMQGLNPELPPPDYTNHQKLFMPESWERLSAALSQTIESGVPYELELQMLKPDGNQGWMLARGEAVQDSGGVIVALQGTALDITEQKLAEDKIKSLLAEKDIILKEVHHRIKNNMSLMYGILFLQVQSMKEPTAIMALEDACNRIQAMGLLYEKLYRSTDVQKISVKEYLPPLINEILNIFPNSKSITLKEKLDDFILDASRLQTIGIIINELLTNILKYAFTDRSEGLISVEAVLNPSLTGKDSLVSIAIEDNGIGIPESVSFENSTGFGLQLISLLTKQLKGTIRIERGNHTRVVLEFKK